MFAKFILGRILATPALLEEISIDEVQEALARHLVGDWGDISDEDRAANEEALSHGERLLSAYKSSKGIHFWIVTERDRSATVVLMPDDY